ncbi:MAG: tetratricopeptide repeat protein [Bacteroidales bacterium]|nr:tetratricopeptide repeat protein [Bacteroidales bacterium]MDD3891301.1 tetratricopeptide repeat protein [Bacteroidales bacterium]
MKRKLFVIVLMLLGFSFSSLANPYIDSLKRVEALADHDSTRYKVLFDLGLAYYDSVYDKSIHYFEQALAISTKRNAWEQVADIHHRIAMLYFNQGEFDKSLFECQNALSVYTVHNDAKGAGEVNNSIGVLYKTWGRYSKALEYFFLALSEHEKIGYSAGIGMASNNIGQIFFYLEDYKKAIDYFTIYYEISKSSGTAYAVAGVANNIAASYVELNQHEKAINSYKEAAHIYDSLNLAFGVAIINDNIGSLLAKNHDYQGALKHHLGAMQVFIDIGNKTRLSYVLKNVGYAYFKLNDYTKSKQYLLQGMQLAKELKHQETLKLIYFHLSQVFEATHKPSQALRYHKLFIQIKDSLHSIEAKENLNRMELGHEADKYQTEVTYLSAKVEQHQVFLLFLALLVVLFVSVGVIFVRVNHKQKLRLQDYAQSINDNSEELNRMASNFLSSPKNKLAILWPEKEFERDTLILFDYDYGETKGLLAIASKNLPLNYLVYLIKNSIDHHFRINNTITEQEVETIVNSSIKNIDRNIYISDSQASICSIFQYKGLKIKTKNSTAVWVNSGGDLKLFTENTDLLNNAEHTNISQLFILISNVGKNSLSFTSLVSLIDKTLKLLMNNSEDSQIEIIRSTIESWNNSVHEETEVHFFTTKWFSDNPN